jgi:molybdate transport system substrate-binding protein
MPASVASAAISGIASMAVAQALKVLCADYASRTAASVDVIAIGGVDAFRRVAAGEALDFVVLADAAIGKLAAAGHVDAASRVGFAMAAMAAAVPSGIAVPTLADGDAVRDAVLRAPRVAYSTGPSGQYLLELLARWGIAEEVRGRLVQAPPGVGVATLLARGDAALGFQQLSEMLGAPGITIAGPLPPDIQRITRFVAAVCTQAPQPAASRALLAWLAGDAAAVAKRRYGLAPCPTV